MKNRESSFVPGESQAIEPLLETGDQILDHAVRPEDFTVHDDSWGALREHFDLALGVRLHDRQRRSSPVPSEVTIRSRARAANAHAKTREKDLVPL